MDLTSGSTSPVLTDNTRLGIHSALLPYTHTGSTFSPALLLTIPRKRPGLLDDVKSSLLDTMKSSSPTHNRIIKDSNNETAQTDGDLAYKNWMVLHFMLVLVTVQGLSLDKNTNIIFPI